MALIDKYPRWKELDMRTFANQVRDREAAIQATPLQEIKTSFLSNEKARLLHPTVQKMKIIEIIDHGRAEAKTIVMQKTDGTAAAWFRAGQYIDLALEIDGAKLTRAYSLCYSPLLSRQGIYAVTVKRNPAEDAFASNWILDTVEVGQELTVSEPHGDFCYEPVRDRKKVAGLAGGSGITPFLSMAYAIRDGIEDFELTILFGSRTEDGILFRQELDDIAAECEKVKVVHILSDEEKDGFEHGFISGELIEKYVGKDCSLFVCGPAGLYHFIKKEAAALGIEARYVRNKLRGVTRAPWELKGYPAEVKGKTYTLTVKKYGEVFTVPAFSGEPLLCAIERAGISAPSRCRSGECGWCRSKLNSGEVFVPEDNDGRRAADIIYGYIHPCSSFPLSDVELELCESELFD